MLKVRKFAWLPPTMGAGPAFAHSPVPGIEGFYVGLLHPFSTPPQALLMFGLALLIGGFIVEKARWLMLGFLIATFVGLATGSATFNLDASMFAVAFAVCAFAALAPGRLAPTAFVLAAVGGFLIGEASIPDPGPTRDRVFTMSGSVVGANLGLLYLFGASLLIRERWNWPWVGVAFRVAAAWLGAVALLMLALAYAAGTAPM